MAQLVMPSPLDPRLFHSRQKIDAYNSAVADYMSQQAEAEFNHCKKPKRKHVSKRDQFNEQY